MKRGKKLLIMLLALAVISAGAWAVTKLTAGQEAPDPEDTVQSVYTLDVDSLTTLSWTYEENTFTFEHTGDSWIYSPDSAFPVDESYLEAIVTALEDVTAGKVIDAPGDLAQFGLDDPICSVTVNDTAAIQLGNETTMGGERYLSNGDGKVYLVDSALLDSFACQLLEMIAYEEIPDLSTLTGIVLTTETETVELIYQENSGLAYSDHYSWFRVQDGSYTPVDMEAMEDLLNVFTSLAWVGCVDYQAEGDALAAYGLDTPAATYELHYEDSEASGTFILELGDGLDADNCYAKLAGSSVVYLIDGDVSSPLIAAGSETLLVDDVLKLDMDTVESVEIELDGVIHQAEKTTVQTTNEDGTATEETVWILDGEEAEIEDVLTGLTELTGENGGTDLTPERSMEIRFTFRCDTDTFSQIELIFYQYDSTNCLVSLNGETKLLIPRSAVVSVVEQINALILG